MVREGKVRKGRRDGGNRRKMGKGKGGEVKEVTNPLLQILDPPLIWASKTLVPSTPNTQNKSGVIFQNLFHLL